MSKDLVSVIFEPSWRDAVADEIVRSMTQQRKTAFLAVRVGFVSRRSFRRYLRALVSRGHHITWQEGEAFFDDVWYIDGDDASIEAVRRFARAGFLSS